MNVVVYASNIESGFSVCTIGRQRGAGLNLSHEETKKHLPIIKEFVLPGTTVHSDGWGACNNLGNNGYEHRRFIHEENFVDPETGVHTQGLEAYWSRAKHKIKAMYGSKLVPSYIDEFLWRERFGKTQTNLSIACYSIFRNIITDIYQVI